MTYSFPQSLDPLRRYLKSRGFDGDAIKTSRQAAFVAQQLLGSRVKFPPQGQDMTPTLLSIQAAIGGVEASSAPGLKLPPNRAEVPAEQGNKGGRSQPIKGGNFPPYGKKANYAKHFTPDKFSKGVHIFCDGAAVPNPGLGGWGVAVFRDGVEIDSAFGGEAEATNNKMELTALLTAIEKAVQMYDGTVQLITIWCDSQYCVKGVNEWMAGWKANGWQRGSDKADPKNRILLNADLWQAIDGALGNMQNPHIAVRWVKGHIGVAGNERADDLAEMGRHHVQELHELPAADDLDDRYRQIMGVM